MPDSRPHLIISENPEKLPILIIDKNGIIAESLTEQLKDQFQILLLTSRKINQHDNVETIYYSKKIPMIPDQNYSEIFIIYHGEGTTTDILPPVAQKAVEINANLTFITSLYYYDKKLRKILSHKKYENIKQLIYGEVFGNEELEQNLVTNYINQIRHSNKIEIPGSGLQKTYPVLFQDICDAIITTTFSQSPKSGITLILPKHGFTQLAIARAFQKHAPDIKINFKKNTKETEYDLPQEAEYFFSNYDLAEKLNKIDLSQKDPSAGRGDASAKKKQTRHPGENKKIHRPQNPKPTNKYAWLLLCALFFLLPIVLEFLLLVGGGYLLSASLKTAQSNNFSTAQKYNFFAKAAFFTSGYICENMAFINPLLFFQKDPLTQASRIGNSLAIIEGDFLDSAILAKAIYSDKSTDPKKDFLHIIAKVKNSLISLQKLKAEGGLPRPASEKIKELEQPLSLLGETIDALPDLLGFSQKKKYLILFQNNMELRPGGGFIGSFATVTIQNGKTGKLEIHDVYDADGKLSTHVEPPFAFRRYLGASHLFLRDSNFDVDFVVNAREAQKFLELETGEKADGVIAIDTDFVKSLIAVFGPLQLPDFNETVSADNFYLKTQTHAEKDFFPGSTQKKDFLRAVYNALELKIAEDKKIPYTLLAQKITEAFKKKQILIATSSTDSQKLFTVNNLSGSLQDNRIKADNQILDFIGVSEANLGMNKTNFYLKRSIEQKTVLDENGGLTGAINILYENTSDKDSVFGGDYKNFLRFILPAGAELQSVMINDNLIPTTDAVTNVADYTRPGFIPPQQLEIEKKVEEGKMIYGFLTIVPIRSSEKISITYSLGRVFDPNKSVFDYSLYRFKQPGTGDDPYSFSISYPNSFHAIQGAGKFTDVGGKLLYSDTLSEDKEINLTFSKK